MARQPRSRIVVPDHPHHVILRGNNRRRLFSYPREHRFFLRRLGQSSVKHGVPIHAEAQMANHIHLVVTPASHRTLSDFVRFVAQTFAQYRNTTRSASGKLFEERYRSIPITTDAQMAATVAYIELNPVRAGLCEDPGTYPWSTYASHTGIGRAHPLVNRLWTPSGWYLSLGADTDERAGAYLDWFEHYRKRDDWSAVYPDPAEGSGRRRFERPDRRAAT